MLLLQPAQPVGELIAAGVHVVHEPVGAEHLDGRQGGRASDRIAAIRAAVRSGRPTVVEFAAGAERRERESRGDALGHAHDVRLDVVVLDGEHLAGAAETALHLVGDEQHSVVVAASGDRFEELGRRGDVTALAEHRFDDDRGRFTGGRDAGEELVEAGECSRDLVGEVVGTHVRVRGDEDARRQRCVTGAVDGLRRGHRHRLVRAPVEAALEHDDVRPPGRLLGELDGRLGDLRARVGVEERVDAVGRDLGEARREGLQQIVGVHVGLGVHETLRLSGDRCGDVRVAVAGGGDGDATAEIEVPLAGGGGDPRPVAGRDLEIGHLEPHMRQVVGAHRHIIPRTDREQKRDEGFGRSRIPARRSTRQDVGHR